MYRIYTYIRLILSLTRSTREETLDAEESEAAAGAAGGAAPLRTEMDSGSKEREIRGGSRGMEARRRGGRVREFTTRERESSSGMDARATRRTGVGCAHEGRLKGEKEDGIKRGKKKKESRATRGKERKRKREKYEGRERERPCEKWAPSERGQPRATSRDATLFREGFVLRL